MNKLFEVTDISGNVSEKNLDDVVSMLETIGDDEEILIRAIEE